MSKSEVIVYLEGEELPPYLVDESRLAEVSLGEFLENMPYQDRMLIEAVGDNRVSINGREVEANDWYTTYLGGSQVFIAILSGGVVAGIEYP